MFDISFEDFENEDSTRATLWSLRKALNEAGYTGTLYCGQTWRNKKIKMFTVSCKSAGSAEYASINICTVEPEVLTMQLSICSKPIFGTHTVAGLCSEIEERNISLSGLLPSTLETAELLKNRIYQSLVNSLKSDHHTDGLEKSKSNWD